MIDDKEYLVMSSGCSVTIIVGKWIHDRRSLGKTFWQVESVRDHYKKHGKVLAEYAEKLMG